MSVRRSSRKIGEVSKDRFTQFQLSNETNSLEETTMVKGSKPNPLNKKNSKRISSKNRYSQIPEAPQIHLTKDQMNGDPIQLIMCLDKIYNEFGAVKLTSPPEWNPSFNFKYSENPIPTRVQVLHRLSQGKGFIEHAKNFDKTYVHKTSPAGATQEEKNQQQFWNIVNADISTLNFKIAQKNLYLKTKVEYAADLPVTKFGSGFPVGAGPKSKDENFDYANNFFNLNRTFEAPSSLARISKKREELISGITSPWVYMGMKFSTFCWHVEDLWINSLNYNHIGSVKTWYVVPGADKQKFDHYVSEKTGSTKILNKITFLLDPLQLIQNGIRVYKVNQRPGDYVCTFFQAYHCGFSQGFNVCEAVNFLSVESLPVIQKAYSFSTRPQAISYQWLVKQNFEQWKNDKQSLIFKAFKKIVSQESRALTKLASMCQIVKGRQIGRDKKYYKNICSKCRNYQYLSSLQCQDCGKNYCFSDLVLCCKGKYELVYRQLCEERADLRRFIGDCKK